MRDTLSGSLVWMQEKQATASNAKVCHAFREELTDLWEHQAHEPWLLAPPWWECCKGSFTQFSQKSGGRALLMLVAY